MTITTNVSERLPALLDELARSTPIHNDDTPFNPQLSMFLGDTGDADRPRWFAAAAAAVLVIAGAGALTVAQSDNEPAPAAATQPSGTAASLSTEPVADSGELTEPTLFPTIDEPPPGLEITARIESVPAQALFTEALIGRPNGAGIADSIVINVQADPFNTSPMLGRPATTAEVFGQTATVHDYGVQGTSPLVVVTWGSGPFYLATGSDPLAFLDTALPDTFTATSTVNEPPLLAIGQLPEGFEIIVEPEVVGHATTSATLSIGADNYDISVSTHNPAVAMSQAGPLRRVDVNGHTGWMFDTSAVTQDAASRLSQDVAWEIDDSTYAYLKINDGTNADDALDLAKRITFIDRDSWTTRYIVNSSDTAPATDPIGSSPDTPTGT